MSRTGASGFRVFSRFSVIACRRGVAGRSGTQNYRAAVVDGRQSAGYVVIAPHSNRFAPKIARGFDTMARCA
jgi:hypothetical protein